MKGPTAIRRLRTTAKESLLQRWPGLFWSYVRLRHGYLEPELALLPHLCRSDRLSVDVGANYGLFTYYLLRHSAGCVAFEPYPHLARLLRRGYGSRLVVHEVALSNRAGRARLQVDPQRLGYSTIEERSSTPASEGDTQSLGLEVAKARLDDFDLDAVGLMKIDVEGHELEVLEGAERTIARDAPTIIVEAEERWRRGSPQRTRLYLEGMGYRGYYLRSGKLVDIASFDPLRDQGEAQSESYVRNFVFLPDELASGSVELA